MTVIRNLSDVSLRILAPVASAMRFQSNHFCQVCSTYPHAVIVPKSIDDETLIKAAAFRMGGRFPVFSYFHKDSKVSACTSIDYPE